jgi:hypothetical protein
MGPEVLYGRNHRLIVPSLKPHHSLTYSLTRTEDRTGQNEGFVNFSHLKGAPPLLRRTTRQSAILTETGVLHLPHTEQRLVYVHCRKR